MKRPFKIGPKHENTKERDSDREKKIALTSKGNKLDREKR